MLRSAWLAQELLTTFEQEVTEVSLRPDHSGGVFTVQVNDELVYSRATGSGFPELSQLKQLVRDRVAPGKSLGHSDNPKNSK